MRVSKCLMAVALMLGVAGLIWAEVDANFQTAMKAAGAACGRLKKNVEAKGSADDIAKDAEEVAQNFRKMGAYWKQHQVNDAMDLCRKAFGSAMAVSKAAKAGNMDEVASNFKTLTGTCAPCHTAHREKAADGSYSIK